MEFGSKAFAPYRIDKEVIKSCTDPDEVFQFVTKMFLSEMNLI